MDSRNENKHLIYKLAHYYNKINEQYYIGLNFNYMICIMRFSSI